MRRARAVVVGVVLSAAVLALAGCSPAVPVAYHVSAGVVDVAFCEEFRATQVVIEFSDYPPVGSRTVVATVVRSGEPREFALGVPISTTIQDWEFTADSTSVPSEWDRVDFSFYDGPAIYVEGVHLFRRDVLGDDWAWTRGPGMLQPTCELKLDRAGG